LSGDFSARLARFEAGSRLAGYRLETPVGAGGMAVVWRARHERLDRLVALKILDPARASNPAFRQRFDAEAQAVAKVEHPHIIRVYDAGDADGVLFIAMQFVPGGDLGRLLEREGPLSRERAVEIISPVASALDHAHAAGLVHRDVKPANILVDTRADRPGHVYLSDFGIAKAELSAMTLTEPGNWIGTPNYSAPEQLDGLAVDGRADQYALACVAYRLLTGVDLFERDQPTAVNVAHMFADPPPLTARRPDLPAAADRVLARALAKAPDERYESCGGFAGALREALGVLPSGPGGSAAALAPRKRTATLPGSAGAPPAHPVLPSEPSTAPAARPAVADARASRGSAGQAAARPEMTARRLGQVRRRPRPGLSLALSLAVLVAAAAVIIVAVGTRHTGTLGSAATSGTPASASMFLGYPRQRGAVTVNSMAGADGTWLAAGGADGHPALWRRGANGAWTLVSANSPQVNTLSGALTSIAHGPKGWIAVGRVGSHAGARPVAVTSGDGVNWRADGAAFPGKDPSVTAVAVVPAGYVAVGTQASSYGSHRTAAMWWSADLRAWNPADNDYGGILNGKHHPSFADAVAPTPTGTFVAVGSGYGPGNTDCAVWTPVQKSGKQWVYKLISPPPGASSAALSLVTVNGSGIAVAAGDAVLEKGGEVPIVVVRAGGGRWTPIELKVPPGSQGTVTALTDTDSAFIVAGEIRQAGGAQHAVTWSLPDHNSSIWRNVLSVSRGVPAITALSAVGDLPTGAAQQGPTAHVITFSA
jgi:Protein kinase domain